jgi:hypothetical protein
VKLSKDQTESTESRGSTTTNTQTTTPLWTPQIIDFHFTIAHGVVLENGKGGSSYFLSQGKSSWARWAKKGALDSQSQVIKFTSCLPMVGGSLRVPRLPPPLKLVAIWYSWNIVESGVKTPKIKIKQNYKKSTHWNVVK